MLRLVNAFRNSLRAFRRLLATEKAFQQEILLLLASLPSAWYLSDGWRGFALLVGSILLLIIVEVLNTGIEAACDAFSREFNTDIQLAKDCGSLAVLIAIVMTAGVWLLALADRIAGVAQ